MPFHLTVPDHGQMGDDPVQYQIRVNGHLGPTLLSAFPGLAPQWQGAETVLTGLLDTAALYGVLAEVEALGLDLLEVRKVRPRPQQDLGFA
jgi:monoterpene epsilon-lactone hydrolase